MKKNCMKKRMLFLIVVLLLVPIVAGDAFLQDYMYEGETVLVPVNGGQYEITLIMVSDTQETVIFSVNGELTKALREKEKDYLSDGSRIFVGDVLIDEDGKDLVQFYFMGTGKGVVRTTVAEEADIPYEDATPGLLESPPVFKPSCEGCEMNGECFAYGYRFDPDEETTVVCSADGDWEEVREEPQAVEIESLFSIIVDWIASMFG